MSWPVAYRTIADLPAPLAVFPLGGAIVLPRARLPLNIFEPRYLTMIDDAMRGSRVIGMIQPSEPGDEKPALFQTGCAARIVSYTETPDRRFMITLAGLCRFQVKREIDAATPYRQVEPDYGGFVADLTENAESGIETSRLLEILREYLKTTTFNADWGSLGRAPAEALVNSLSQICPFSTEEKQALLEARSLAERVGVLQTLMEIAVAGRSSGGQSSVQ
jgi:Lon protease-like protein